MKINPAADPLLKDVTDAKARRSTGPAGAGQADASIAASAATEKIQLSGTSKAMTEMYSEPFDAAKVAEIRKAISEGRFNINAERVAERLIDESAELLVRIFGRQPDH